MTQANYELFETFEKNSSELYWLALLLTANTDRGVQAFDRALDFAADENPGFGGFMNEWARKLVIVEALGTIRKELRASIERTKRLDAADGGWARPVLTKPEIDREAFEEAVMAIDAFPRCAMLLTIHEGMPIGAVSLLLNADEALTRVAQRIGIVQLSRNLAGNSGRDPYPGLQPIPVLSLS
jgi:hypothetical protein